MTEKFEKQTPADNKVADQAAQRMLEQQRKAQQGNIFGNKYTNAGTINTETLETSSKPITLENVMGGSKTTVRTSDSSPATTTAPRPVEGQTISGSEPSKITSAPRPGVPQNSGLEALDPGAGKSIRSASNLDGGTRPIDSGTAGSVRDSKGATTISGTEQVGAVQRPIDGISTQFRVGDSGSKTSSESPLSSPAKPGVITFTPGENGGVIVGKVTTPNPTTGVQDAAAPRSVTSPMSLPDGGQQKPLVAPETQPRSNFVGEQSGGQNQTRTVTPERVDVSATTLKGNAAPSVETANFARPNAGSLENQNSAKPPTASLDAQTRTAPGVSPDAASRDLGGRDALTRTNVGGSALDSQGRQIPAVGADKQPLVVDNRQAPTNTASARLGGPQPSLDSQGKQISGNAPSESFGARRESGLQLPDTKQASGRTDSGVQLPDTKQSSGRTDTGGTKLPDARNDTGRNDANTGKLPDAKTLANLDQKFGDKVNPPGKGGGVPIAIPGIPDILGGLRGDKDSKPGKDAKGDPQGVKDGSVRTEAPGGRDTKDAKGESQSGKDSKVVDGKGDTKAGADDKGQAGQKGARPESDTTTKISDGKAVQDVRNQTQDGKAGAEGRPGDGRGQGGSNLVHDGGTKSDGIKSDGIKSDGSHGGRVEGTDNKGIADKGPSLGDGKTRVDQPGARVVDADGKLIGGRPETGNPIKTDIGDKGHTDVGAGGKAVGSRGDSPFVLPPGSLPVPDLVGGIKNIGQQIDGRTGKPIPADDKGLRQPDKIDGTKIDTKGTVADGVKTIVTGGLRPGDKPPVIEGGVKAGGTDGVKTIVTGGVATGDGVKTAVTGGAKGSDGVKVVGANDASSDAKQLPGKNPVGTRLDGAILVPPAAVPLTEMIGNLKGIAARIFPPESRTGRPDAFDNSLPGRKTERLEDRTQSTLGAGARAESTIPIVRVIGERIGKADEQFVIKLPQSALDANKANQTKVETVVANPPWIATEHAVSDKSLPGLKAVDTNVAKPIDAKSIRNDVQHNVVKGGDNQTPHADTHDQVVHDEAAERLLVNLELVGAIESAPAVESEEEEVFPLAAIEYFGEDFEKAISGEEEVMFDGDGTVVEDDEQSTRYQYIVEAGDTVELIAIKVFTNVTLAPLIYEINKDAIPIGMQDGRMVFTLKVGTVIWLPFPKEVKAYMGI